MYPRDALVHIEERPLLSLRPVTPEDEAFLQVLYASAREDVQAWTCGEEEAGAFLMMQYRMQDHFFRAHYPEADYAVVHDGGKDVGRIYVARTAEEIRILDITLLSEQRNRGIGSTIIREILREAECARIPVRLMVERFNRARTLYERLGFRVREDVGTHFVMEWNPQHNR